MRKDEIFFASDANYNGPQLTSTSANYIANVAKECYRLLEEKLGSVIFYTTTVGLISSDSTKTLREGDGYETLNEIPSALENIAKLKSLIAWLREAIKAKDRLIKEANSLTDSEVCKTLDIELPEVPKIADVPTEDDVIATYNIKQRNRIYYLNTLCAEIGQYIHLNGTLANERTILQKVLSEKNTIVGNGRDAIIYTKTPTVDIDSVDKVFFSLQKKYREYQAEYNSLMHGVETTIQEAQKKANLEYEEAYANYNSKMAEIRAKVKAYKDEQVTKAQSLKIIIPDSLKPIYDEVQAIGKK